MSARPCLSKRATESGGMREMLIAIAKLNKWLFCELMFGELMSLALVSGVTFWILFGFYAVAVVAGIYFGLWVLSLLTCFLIWIVERSPRRRR